LLLSGAMRTFVSSSMLAAAVLTAALGGCGGSGSDSSSGGELSTHAQAKAFIAAVAGGGSPSNWHLAPGASAEAKRAWKERTAIADYRGRIRGVHAAWPCELAEDALAVGFGKFDVNDRVGVTKVALQKGAPAAQVKPMVLDVEAIAYPDLKIASHVICPGLGI
jgi:hypothetical protein